MLKLKLMTALAAAALAACTAPVGPQSSGIDPAPQWTKLEDVNGAANAYLVADASALLLANASLTRVSSVGSRKRDHHVWSTVAAPSPTR